MNKVTRTFNRLHFPDLDPFRFEDLCLHLVARLHHWKEINHFGRKGSDDGVDIFAIKKESEVEQTWFIQCKRFRTITKADLKNIVDKISANQPLPDKLLVIVACDVSKSMFRFLKDYALNKGITETEVWTASTLEAKLYEGHKDLLFVYFGLKIENKTKENIARIKHSLRIEKRVFKKLIDHKRIKETRDFKFFLYNPWARFISHEVYIRSVNDTTYPIAEETPSGNISPWFRTFFYNTYHNGIELWLDAGIGTTVIMDKDGYWEPLSDSYDERKENTKYRVVRAKTIGRIPFHNIIDFKTDGDEYTSEPHLFCKFDNDGMPYEEIYYKSEGDPKQEIPDWDFDREKRTTFPK